MASQPALAARLRGRGAGAEGMKPAKHHQLFCDEIEAARAGRWRSSSSSRHADRRRRRMCRTSRPRSSWRGRCGAYSRSCHTSRGCCQGTFHAHVADSMTVCRQIGRCRRPLLPRFCPLLHLLRLVRGGGRARPRDSAGSRRPSGCGGSGAATSAGLVTAQDQASARTPHGPAAPAAAGGVGADRLHTPRTPQRSRPAAPPGV
jgi:hypothetical protein